MRPGRVAGHLPLVEPRSWKSGALTLPPLGHNRARKGVTLHFLPVTCFSSTNILCWCSAASNPTAVSCYCLSMWKLDKRRDKSITLTSVGKNLILYIAWHIAHWRQECHKSKFGVFWVIGHHHHLHHHVQEGLGLIPVPCILKMKLWKEKSADALLTGIVS